MKKKALFSAVLASSLLFSSLPVTADEISDLQSKREAQENKKSQLQADLKDVQKDMGSVEDKISGLNKVISANLADISTVENKINKTKKSIEDTEHKIEKANNDLEKKKKILSKNLRIMYSKGKVSYIEFLFRSENVSDFLYRFNSLEDIAQANEKLYKEIQELLDLLKDQKDKLVKDKASLDKQKAKLDTLNKTLKVQQAEQLDAMQMLQAQEHHISNEVDEQDNAINSINSEIASIIRKREEARRQALEKQRQQQQQQQQNNQNQSNNNSSGGGDFGNEIESTGQFAMPMKAGTYYISSYFGMRIHPVTGVAKGHNGVDFAASLGTPIYAIDSGTVLFAGPASGYGHWVVIDHNNGFYSIYGHMYANGIYVMPGQTVTKGQKLAVVGSDGTSTGSHLHLSLSNGFNGSTFSYVDPMTYLK